MLEIIRLWLMESGASVDAAQWGARALIGLGVILLSGILDFVFKRVAVRTLKFAIARTRAKWDDVIVEHRVLDRLSHLVPALVIYNLAGLPFIGLEEAQYTAAVTFVHQAVLIYVIVIGILIINASLNAALDIYGGFAISREMPAKGFTQVLKLLTAFIGGILVFSILLDRNPVYFLSGLGALTAVLLLIFRDAILGFVAGIQLSANKMVAVGDWIEMPKYGADGDVIEVALTTVKVQNWDRTVTTIPAYALISDSFKNWRSMFQAGGRRIKRAVYIDMNTITFCDEDMLERFAKIRYITDYIQKKKDELSRYNADLQVDNTSLVNGRRMTNIGTFRAYISAYLRNHPMIRQDMTFLVRQLAPMEHGLPIEIYVFSKDTAWANYEGIQADIFDHILSVVPQFDLRVFQEPSGTDFRAFKNDA